MKLIDGLGADWAITGLLVLMTVLVLANAAIGAVGSFLLERTAESVVLARRRLVGRLLWLRIPALDDTEPGDLMSRVSADTTLLREVSTQSLVSAVTSILTLGTVTMMALLDVVTLVALGLAQIVVGVVVPRISRAAKQGVGRRDERSTGTSVGPPAHCQGIRRRGPRTRPAGPGRD